MAVDVYRATHTFPREEVYGLTSQIRRAALSTPTNIVEGSKRNTRISFRHFINIAQGSNEEVKYLLLVSVELGYVLKDSADRLSSLAEEVGAMLHALAAGLHTQL